METIVVKFGGSSLADAYHIRKAFEIIRENPARRFVVCSAPGKRDSGDEKVTDLLYLCQAKAEAGENYSDTLAQITERFSSIITGLGVSFDLDAEIAAIREHLETSCQQAYMASRGEYLNSKILAAYLGFPFVDPAGLVLFDEKGELDAGETNLRLGLAMVEQVRDLLIPALPLSGGGADDKAPGGVFSDDLDGLADMVGVREGAPAEFYNDCFHINMLPR